MTADIVLMSKQTNSKKGEASFLLSEENLPFHDVEVLQKDKSMTEQQ